MARTPVDIPSARKEFLNQMGCDGFIKLLQELRSKCQSGIVVDMCTVFAADYEHILPFLVYHLSIGFGKIWLYNKTL